jgi:uncharacterized repeat protein (TIGR03837 family)
MLWDLFCRVIDNHGDVGVCWRLARALSARGQQVRLWLDNDRALRWMAPWQPGVLAPGGVEVRAWGDAEVPMADDARLLPADVVIEAFGCNLPEAHVARMKARHEQGLPLEWVNLEYLSAEDYVERSHGLQSPVMSGPGQGLRKRFFYPGFTVRTGGLLQPSSTEQGSTQDRRGLRQCLVADLAAQTEVPSSLADSRPGDTTIVSPRPNWAPIALDAVDAPWVLAFCYDNAPLGTVLDALARQCQATGWPPAHVWLTPGPATALGAQWFAKRLADGGPAPLQLHPLPHLPQADFDRWLDACDLNLVRGEDSAVRALWPGRPHLWQLYVQDDGVHADKMHAFTQRWMADWPQPLRDEVLPWWRLWNGLATGANVADEASSLPAWWAPPHAPATSWMQAQVASAQALRAQTDLATQLMAFVKHPG